MRKRVIVCTVLTLLFDFCERTVYRQAESSPRLFLWTLRACCKTTPILFCFNLIENHSKLLWLFCILVRLTGFGLFSLTWYFFFFSMCSFLHVCGHSSFFRHVCLRILWHLVEHSYELATQHAWRLVFYRTAAFWWDWAMAFLLRGWATPSGALFAVSLDRLFELAPWCLPMRSNTGAARDHAKLKRSASVAFSIGIVWHFSILLLISAGVSFPAE